MYMRALPAIVSLSVAVAATATLATNTHERLNWLEVVLDSVNPQVSFTLLLLLSLPA